MKLLLLTVVILFIAKNLNGFLIHGKNVEIIDEGDYGDVDDDDDDTKVEFNTRLNSDDDDDTKAEINMRRNRGEITQVLQDENDEDEYCEWYKCDKDLRQPRGFRRFLDISFLKKFFRNLSPLSRPRLQMNFYLFKREFPDCGRELTMTDDSLLTSGLNASHPTRIIIHGWMSQSRGSFNRDIKNAYLKRGDYNVIIADWSSNAANLNYFHVVNLIETFGAYLAEFSKQLYDKVHINFNDIYLIGHSLGAQIAGAAGKRAWPNRYNTIFALDPAGPRFRRKSTEFRIDPTDAKYVESIQTSRNLGFLEPTGNATFYPNYGTYQKNCYYVGCSHIRAYKMFAESINSPAGFWGIRCRRRRPKWECDDTVTSGFRMGGEPSMPKAGLFYVKTKAQEPFALGQIDVAEE